MSRSVSGKTRRLLQISLESFDPASSDSTQDPLCPFKVFMPTKRTAKKILGVVVAVVMIATCYAALIQIGTALGNALDAEEAENRVAYKSCDVIFLRTSIEGRRTLRLGAREACAVESAAMHMPNATVCVAMAVEGDSRLLAPARNQLRNVDNAFVVPLDFDAVFRGTPLDAWWKEDFQFAASPWRPLHLSEAARVAFLYKYGGLYLDLDMIVLRKGLLDEEQPNYLGLQGFNGDDGASAAVLKFTQGHPFLAKWLYAIPTKYMEEDRDCIGPGLLTRLLVPYCQGDRPDTESSRRLEELSGKSCDWSLKIFPPKTFYPIPWTDWKSFFRDDQVTFSANETYTVHLWNELSRRFRLEDSSVNSAFARLARANCPNVFFREIEPKQKHGEQKRINSKQLALMFKWSQRGGDAMKNLF